MSTFERHVSESLGRIEAKLDDLSGDHGRVTKLENRVQWDETKQWLHTALIIPITTSLTYLIRHLTK
jgi:hypothetical protein